MDNEEGNQNDQGTDASSKTDGDIERSDEGDELKVQ